MQRFIHLAYQENTQNKNFCEESKNIIILVCSFKAQKPTSAARNNKLFQT
jgi:hypothetical protein